jgi:hypothetical protein
VGSKQAGLEFPDRAGELTVSRKIVERIQGPLQVAERMERNSVFFQIIVERPFASSQHCCGVAGSYYSFRHAGNVDVRTAYRVRPGEQESYIHWRRLVLRPLLATITSERSRYVLYSIQLTASKTLKSMLTVEILTVLGIQRDK